MRHTFAQHFGILHSAFQRMFSSKLAGLFNILVIGIAISLPAGMYALLQNAQGLIAQFSGTPQISLFLNLDAKAEEIERLHKQLVQHPDIARIEFIPRTEALEKLKHNTGLDDVIGSLNQNPLPDALIVYPKQNEASSLNALRNELAKSAQVEHAQLDSDWAYKLEALLKLGRFAVAILAGLLSLALVTITFNTIRLQILTQRDEIEVSWLIGATNSFIRRPFLYFGALQGLLGGITAWFIVAAELLLLNRPLGSLSQLYASQFLLHAPAIGDSLSLLIFSAYLGWLGAWLSVAQHLSRIESR